MVLKIQFQKCILHSENQTEKHTLSKYFRKKDEKSIALKSIVVSNYKK